MNDTDWLLRRCVFCESAGPLTDEDAFANWARLLLGERGAPVTVTRRGRSWRLRLVARQALCQHCNNVWLGGYEARFKNLMARTIRDPARVELDAEEQQFVAIYAIKTGLLLELAYRWQGLAPIPLPASVFRWLHLHKTPPPRSLVWFGATGTQQGEAWRVAPYANEALVQHGSSWPTGNIITFAIGHLVLKCAVVQFDPLDPGTPWTPQFNAHFAQIWPIISDPVVWPTPLALTQTEFESMAVRLWPIPPPPGPPKPWPRLPKVTDDWR